MDKEINNKMVMEEMRAEAISDDTNDKRGILITDLKVQECEETLNRHIHTENKTSAAKQEFSELKQDQYNQPDSENKCQGAELIKSDSNTTGNFEVENKTCQGNELTDVEKDDKFTSHSIVEDNMNASQNDVCLGYEDVNINNSKMPGFAKQNGIFDVDKLVFECKTEMHSMLENHHTTPELSAVQSVNYNRSEKGDACSCPVNTRNDASPLLKRTLIGLQEGSLEQTKLCKSSCTTGAEIPLRTMSTICTNTNVINKSMTGSGDHLNQLQHNLVSQKIGLNSHYPNLSKALSDPKIDLLQFAERLYKCTLCTSIPSILTSRSSFLQHVQEQHLNTHGCFKHCKMCSLKFHTEEDLKEHVLSYHVNNSAPFKDKPSNNVEASTTVSETKLPTGSPVPNNCVKPSNSPSLECIRSTIVSSLENLPSVRTSDIIKSADALVDNESDSDSSGHRQYKAKVVRRNKPQYDFENPKQLVDHAGIETLDGSLDLTKKIGNEDLSHSSVIAINHDRNSPRIKEEVNLASVQQITEQIMKSNAAQTKGSVTKSEQKYGFVPSFTPEFGKFTKLVREGGNIVYFCQVCNWKSPVKTTFQSHCTLTSHKNKVSSAEDSDTGGSSEQTAKTSPKTSKTTNTSVGNHNVSVGNNTSIGRTKDASPWAATANGQNSASKMAERNSVFYNYIRQRRSQHANRTPVVSMFGNGFDNQSEFTYRFPQEHEAAFFSKKKRRPLSYLRTTSQKPHNSESDSDDSKTSGDQEAQWKCHTASTAELLRSKILSGYLSSEKQNLKHNSFERCSQQAFDNEEMAPNKISVQESPNFNLSLVKTEKPDLSDCGKHMLPGLNPQKRHSTSPEDTSSKRHKYEQNEQGNGSVKDSFSNSYRFMPNKCSICSYEYSDIDDYEKHFAKDHAMDGVAPPSGPFPSHPLWGDVRGGSDCRAGIHGKQEELGMRQSSDMGSAEMGENWRVQKLKDILSDYLVASETANVSRDYLLQCVSLSSDLSEAVLWSSACNKAIRELFPSSLARRKGKYKNYYFGVAMVEPPQGQEEMTEGEGQLYQPRDISADMEVIMEQLPAIVKWTGCMERGVYRGDVLTMLASRLGDREAEGWGAQCNRAIRLVYPMVDMKRKGKYKTTIYFGVDFKKRIKETFMQMHLDSRPTAAGACDDPMRIATPVCTEDQPVPSANLDSLATSRLVPNSDRGAPGMVYPQWFKQEAERQMGQYLARFGGVSVYDDPAGSGDAEDDNDGDDEAGSVESGMAG